MAKKCRRCLTLRVKVSRCGFVTPWDWGRAQMEEQRCCLDECAVLTRSELSTRPDLIRRLVPSHAEADLRARGIDIDDFVPIPLEQLRISLDVSLFLWGGLSWHVQTISELITPSKIDLAKDSRSLDFDMTVSTVYSSLHIVECLTIHVLRLDAIDRVLLS